MEPVKDTARVEKMFARGEPFFVDPQSGYRYVMVARCPGDGGYSSVEKVERAGQPLSRVVFACPACASRFEAKPDEIYIW